MAERDVNKLKALNSVVVVMAIANVFIVALALLKYLRDGEFNLLSVAVGLTALCSVLLIRTGFARKK